MKTLLEEIKKKSFVPTGYDDQYYFMLDDVEEVIKKHDERSCKLTGATARRRVNNLEQQLKGIARNIIAQFPELKEELNNDTNRKICV